MAYSKVHSYDIVYLNKRQLKEFFFLNKQKKKLPRSFSLFSPIVLSRPTYKKRSR